ncbi:sigma-54-dependent transcriptional regulator [Oceanidesulfovibrio marinus]|uniref:Sigma-54-dependent Fis family transcriptional regulator n=1 Tax=Oceanidesulfovibrio marinus TaxID=370038 RepID=A0A6P1ZGL2_9BACT|nr:sigma-54 dependent transcriptional regulator [Oceanidesulfovibrio marinus]QJT07921.1 sigma-54-dependent Fis family transcriptional regulator [Oceanidesulfovibrio marinus]TVM33421.1 sigma-54-dependent Fis family transcriptional regulator [Oceanidesulfovibrio marinus]
MSKVLVIDDDEFIRKSLYRLISDMGHDTMLAESLEHGMSCAEQGVDVIFLDLDLPDGPGQDAIDNLCATNGKPEIIVITGVGDNYGAQETLANGVWDYIRKPASPKTVSTSLKSALKYRQESSGRHDPQARLDACGIIGEAPATQRTKQHILRAAQSEASVLILGETGVGKELAAHAVHSMSRRRDKPFMVVDCSNLSESLVESILYGHRKGSFTGAHADRRGLVAQANGGTLFLDEVGELPMSLQKSFLRVLQEQRFRPVGSATEETSDFRLVAATNRDLEKMTEHGTFRSDLLFRLRTIELNMPPLRERVADIEVLARHFLSESCNRYAVPPKTLSRQLLKVLTGYAWPGNVRELANVMEAAVIESGAANVVYPKHLPSHIRLSFLDKPKKKRQQNPAQEMPLGELMPYMEYKVQRDRAYFMRLMEACSNDVSEASRLSGLSVPSIYRHLGMAGIPTPSRRRR